MKSPGLEPGDRRFETCPSETNIRNKMKPPILKIPKGYELREVCTSSVGAAERYDSDLSKYVVNGVAVVRFEMVKTSPYQVTQQV